MDVTTAKARGTYGKRTAKDKAFDALFYVILALFSLLCLMPFVHVFSKSVSEEAYVVANKVMLLPKGLSLNAYGKIFSDASILRSMYVSVLVTVTFTLTGLFITICAAYVLSRKHLAGRKTLTFLCMFTLYFSGGIIPDYMLMSNLKMLDTLWCMILPLAFSAYNLLIMKNYFASSIPDSLIESALIDGASQYRILLSVIVPLSKPIIATIALFFAVGRWNAYQDALFYIKQNASLRPLQLKLYYLVVAASESYHLEGGSVGVMTNPEVLKAACVMFATIPILCIYPFVQKYFVQGVMIGAIKG